MGVGYSGTLSNINYSLMVTNGTGYKKNEDDKYKKISGQLLYGEKTLVINDGINLGLAYTMEPKITAYGTVIGGIVAPDTTENNTVIGLFGGYAGKGLRVGGEFDMRTDEVEDKKEQIMAFYASYKIVDSIEGLVYYDMYEFTQDNITTKEASYIIVGLNYYPGKGLIITPNVRFKESTTLAMLNFQFKF